jgi:hypothetical protein
VASPEDAISCYLRTGMDVLVLGDFYITDHGESERGRHEELLPYVSNDLILEAGS